MKYDKEKKLLKIAEESEIYITTNIIKKSGLNSYDIDKLLQQDKIERVKRGVYRWVESTQETSDIAEASLLVPNGVICLFSAFSYYNLTTYIPKECTIAIQMKARKPVLPGFPPIKIYYFSNKRFETGISTVSISGVDVKIYNLEKSICDAVIYRNKIGIDIVKEVLDRYSVRKDKNLQLLMDYAKILKIYEPVKKYMEVLV